MLSKLNIGVKLILLSGAGLLNFGSSAQVSSFDVRLDSIITTFYNIIPSNDTLISRNLYRYTGLLGPDTTVTYQNPNKTQWAKVSEYSEVLDTVANEATSSYINFGNPADNYMVYTYDQNCIISTRWYSTDWGDSAQNYLLQSYNFNSLEQSPCDYDTIFSWTYAKQDTNSNLVIKTVPLYQGSQLIKDSLIRVTSGGDTTYAEHLYQYPQPNMYEKLMLEGLNTKDTMYKLVVYYSPEVAPEKIKMTSHVRAHQFSISRVKARIDSSHFYHYQGNGNFALRQRHLFYYGPYVNTYTAGHSKSRAPVIYPNPASGRLYVGTQPDSTYEYIIINALGQTVLKGVKAPGEYISIDTLSPGLYQIYLKNDSEKWTSSFHALP